MLILQTIFLKYILKDLCEIVENRNNSEKIVSNISIVEKLILLGYKINTINSAISSLIKAALIDTNEQLSDVNWTDLPSDFNIHLTSKGYYYLKDLILKFHYYDLIFQDTPVYDEPTYQALLKEFPTSGNEGVRNLELRKEFIKHFFNYLKTMEQKQSAQIILIYGSLVEVITKSVYDEIAKMLLLYIVQSIIEVLITVKKLRKLASGFS